MKISQALFLLSTFLILAAGNIFAVQPNFGSNILVSDAPVTFSGSSDGPPILDVDIAGGVYVAWIDHRNFQTEVLFSKLSPDGNSFSSNKPLTGINDQKSFPQIEEDSKNIYIAWGERRIGESTAQLGIFFTKSTDRGQTFVEEILVDLNDTLPISMTAHDGKIFIAYSKRTTEIWLATSLDGGNSFTRTKVSDSTTFSRQRPVVDFTSSNVYVFWLDNRNAGRYEVFFAGSSDSGVSFGPNKPVFSHPNSAIHLLGNTFGRLSTKAHQQSIFLAFDFFLQTSNPFTTDKEVYFLKSTDGGNSFSAVQRLSSDDPKSHTIQQNPSLTLLPDGSPVVAWHDFRDGDGKVMLVYSENQGETFSQNFVINNTATYNAFSAPTIVADNEGKIHFVRWDAALSPIGIYYTKIDLDLQFEILPTPFLDLPWDYESKGLSFTEAALAINSYFDHEYPLLSSGIGEPQRLTDSIVSYLGFPRIDRPYSAHDGYDWGKSAKADIGDPVLAAASGCASYFKDGPTGNAIKIDHGNGYQTRYYHLNDNDLVTKSATCTNVTKGQQIGKVGATGNVIPTGDLGAHIHFMLVQDKNKDGNFEDNIPDGITDPFGWQSTEIDPWPNFNFFYNGQNRTGNKSYYLWTKPIANLSDQLTSNGGFFKLEKYKMEFPQGATDQNLTLDMQMSPVAKPSNLLESIGATLTATAKDTLGNVINSFLNFFTITITFDGFDLTGYNLDTISIYSSEDGVNWVKEETTVNINEKTASADINHLSSFALMAERLDTIAPTTTAILGGLQGQSNWFRSDVQVSLDAQDNIGGLGVDYTLYKIGDGDWQQYLEPLIITAEGDYTIEFYSVDKDENIEQIKSVKFSIDKTPPTAAIVASPNILWPPNGKLIDVLITGEASDDNQYLIEVEDEYDEFEPTIPSFDQTIKLKASRKEDDKNGRRYKVKVVDLAGNMAESMAEILVPHDRRNN